METEELLMTSEAGRALKRSAESVRIYERNGKLHAIRTASGHRLFKRSDVEALRLELEKSKRPEPTAA